MAKNNENTDNQEVPQEAKGLTNAYFEEQGAKSKANRANGGEDVKISLTNKTLVRFTKDFGKHLKKGDEMEISDMAFDVYNKAGVIEKL